MSYKDITVDKSILRDKIKKYETCTVKLHKETESNEVYKVICKVTNRQCSINIAHKNGGKTSIWADGKDAKTLGEDIMQFAIEKAKSFSISQVNNTIIIDDNDFEKLLSSLKENNKEIKESDISGGKKYLYNGNNRQKFTFNYYYKRNKLHLQGPPIPFFEEILSELNNLGYDATKVFLSELFEHGGLSDEGIDELYKNNLPNMKEKLPDTIKKILSPSLIFVKINITCDDYAFMVYPALRSIEYIMKEILEKNGFELENGRFSCFYCSNDKYILKISQDNAISTDLQNKLELCYNHYHQYRHSLFHLDNDLTTVKRIDNRDDALNLLFDTFKLMEGMHSEF